MRPYTWYHQQLPLVALLKMAGFVKKFPVSDKAVEKPLFLVDTYYSCLDMMWLLQSIILYHESAWSSGLFWCILPYSTATWNFQASSCVKGDQEVTKLVVFWCSLTSPSNQCQHYSWEHIPDWVQNLQFLAASAKILSVVRSTKMYLFH